MVSPIISSPVSLAACEWFGRTSSKNKCGVFPKWQRILPEKKIELELLMNGGIFEPGGIPSGLLIQQGKELQPVNRNAGEGNFFLQPNGIFLIGSQGAAVMATSEYPPKDPTIHYAVQSGPLLLRK